MQNRAFRFGPLALTSTLTTNILNPPSTAGGVNAGTPNLYVVLKHIRVVNRAGGPSNFSLWLGASGANVAGTEIIGQGLNVLGNSFSDWYGLLRIEANEFLVGGCSAGALLTIQGEGEIGVA